MKNILSYRFGTIFSGKEIKDWILYHLKYSTSHSKEAVKMQKYLNINDNRKYFIKLCYFGTGCSEVIRRPIVVKVS